MYVQCVVLVELMTGVSMFEVNVCHFPGHSTESCCKYLQRPGLCQRCQGGL